MGSILDYGFRVDTHGASKSEHPGLKLLVVHSLRAMLTATCQAPPSPLGLFIILKLQAEMVEHSPNCGFIA